MTKLISINSGQLHAALKKAKEVTSKHPTMELLSNILLKVRRTDVQVIATDLMVTMIATIDISNPGDYGWECLLPAEFMTNLCAKLNSEDLVIKVIEEEVKREKQLITVQHAELSTVYDNYNLNELDDAKDWPALPEFPEGNSTGIGGDFIAWMNRACELVSKDGVRPAMQKIFMGVGYDGICMAATDAHVLMEKKFENECPGWADLLVSTKIAKALAGFKNTTISWSTTHVAFVSETMQLIGTLQDETYPNYKAAIPLPGEESDLLKISHAELKGAMEKISLATDTAKVWLKKGGIEMEGYDPNYNRRVKLQLTGKYAGSIETIFFSTATMLRLLKSIEYQQVTLHINTSNKPVLVTSDSDPTWRGFIMPLSVPE